MKKIIPVVLFAVILLVYQNCQKKDSGAYGVVGNSTISSEVDATPTPEEQTYIKVWTSNFSDFHNTTNNQFDYSDTIYQKVENLGPDGKGCEVITGNFPTQCAQLLSYKRLSEISSWSYDSSTDVWSTHFPAKNYHGMRVEQRFIMSGKTTEGPYKALGDSGLFFVKSVASTATDDIVVFASSDLAGQSVINSIPQNHAFYTHVKLGNTSQKVCQFVTKTVSGQTNTVNNCTLANVNNPSYWIALPDDEVADNNASMTTYYEPANTYHKTGIGNYIYSNGQVYGPFWIFIVDPI